MCNYASVSEVTEGTILVADSGFTCIKSNDQLIVRSGPSGLYVDCEEGKHLLDGQIIKDGHCEPYYVGLYPIREDCNVRTTTDE